MNTVRRFHYLKVLLLLMMRSSTGADWRTSSVSAAAGDVVVYRDALATGWQDWSWQSARNFSNTSPVYAGTRSIAFTAQQAFAGLSLRAPAPINTANYSALEFYGYGSSSGDKYQVYTQPTDSGTASPTSQFNTRPVASGTGEWRRIRIPLHLLGNPAQIQRINIQENAGQTGTIYVDEIKLVGVTTTAIPDTTRDGTRALGGPSGVAVAPNGRAYVAVYPQSRVLSWSNMTSMVSNAAPDRIFGVNASNLSNGDPDANGCTRGASAQLMCGPESVAVDSGGNLYVADTYHQRVLIFFNPDTDATPTTADRVLGQRDFDDTVVNADTVANNSKREGFNLPRGVAVDFADNLYVVDEFNQRVLKYSWPLWGVGGSSEMTIPDAVLGQTNLNTLGTGTSDSGATATNRFRLPLGVAIDGRGNVYVADIWNNRVQRFDYPLTNGEAAARVYTGFFNPHDVAIDPAGTLFVADTKNGKVKAFINPLIDATADREYTGLQFPMGLAFDAAGNLLVADCGRAADGNVNSFPPCRRDPLGVVLFKAPVASTSGPALTVDAAASRRAINPDIYGIN
ncbi:MAG: CBM8, partial [uncultured Chloroflexia bacterium]